MKTLSNKEYDALNTILQHSKNACSQCCLKSVDERWGLIENGREVEKLYDELKARGYIELYACSMAAQNHCRVSSVGRLAMSIYEFCRTMEKV